MNNFQRNMLDMGDFIDNTNEQLKLMENNIQLQIGFGNIAQMATNIRYEYAKSFDLIKRILKRKFMGEYTEFVTYQRVMDDLNEVIQDLDDSEITPIIKPEELQESITVLGSIRDRKLLIELTVPMIDRNLYVLFKLRTLPIKSNGKLVGINIPHALFLVQNDTKTYIPLKDFEDNSYCRDITHTRKLCLPSRALQLADDQDCESNIIFNPNPNVLLKTCPFVPTVNETMVLELYENVYFILPRGKTNIIEKCLLKTPERSQITEMGIIKVKHNCELLVGSQRIIPFQHHIRSNIIDLPTFNHTKAIHIRRLNNLTNYLDDLPIRSKTIFINHNEKLESLQNKTMRISNLLENDEVIEKIEGYSVRNRFDRSWNNNCVDLCSQMVN